MSKQASAHANAGKATPRPKKRFSQNFLIDPNMVCKIVSLAEPAEGDTIIEVGPGWGALTGVLAESKARLVAVEVDEALSSRLAQEYAGNERVEVITADALKFSFLELAKERSTTFKLVSNLPYNVSGPMLAKLIGERSAFSMLVLMFQREVAERIVAEPSTKAYGSLSVLAQTYFDIKREFDVPPELFRPRPKVTSTVLSLRVLPEPRVPVPDEALFKRVVRAAFGQRRKTLRNALKGLGLEAAALGRALTDASIDGSRRGETLGLEEFSRLAIKIKVAQNS